MSNSSLMLAKAKARCLLPKVQMNKFIITIVYFFLSSWMSRIQQMLQSEWFRKCAEFSYRHVDLFLWTKELFLVVIVNHLPLFTLPSMINQRKFITGSCRWGTIDKYQHGMPKVARKAFNIGEVWNPVCCHGNETVKLILQSTFSRIIVCKESNFWYTCKLTEISFFIIFDQNLVEFMMSSLG